MAVFVGRGSHSMICRATRLIRSGGMMLLAKAVRPAPVEVPVSGS
jgi:hypothetical protein